MNDTVVAVEQLTMWDEKWEEEVVLVSIARTFGWDPEVASQKIDARTDRVELWGVSSPIVESRSASFTSHKKALKVAVRWAELVEAQWTAKRAMEAAAHDATRFIDDIREKQSSVRLGT